MTGGRRKGEEEGGTGGAPKCKKAEQRKGSSFKGVGGRRGEKGTRSRGAVPSSAKKQKEPNKRFHLKCVGKELIFLFV